MALFGTNTKEVKMPKKTYHYKVVTTQVIAEKMARYEGSTFEKGEYVGRGLMSGGDEAFAILDHVILWGKEAPDQFMRYRFSFTSDTAPIVERWNSFGVKVATL